MNLQTLKLSFPHWTDEELKLELQELTRYINDLEIEGKSQAELAPHVAKLKLIAAENLLRYESKLDKKEIIV